MPEDTGDERHMMIADGPRADLRLPQSGASMKPVDCERRSSRNCRASDLGNMPGKQAAPSDAGVKEVPEPHEAVSDLDED